MIVRKTATLDHFEGKQAILNLENSQSLAVLREELGVNVQEGDMFTIQILPTGEAEATTEVLAHTILNQLLTDESSNLKEIARS